MSSANDRPEDYLVDPAALEAIVADGFIDEDNRAANLRRFLATCDVGYDFKLSKGYKPVVEYREPADVFETLVEPAPAEGMPFEQLLAEVTEKVVRGSVNFSSAHFLAFPDAGNAVSAMCAHILAGLLNQNLINSVHTSPTATYVELAVIRWLRGLVGYPIAARPAGVLDVGGINVPGGVLANTIGLLLAREQRFAGTMARGFSSEPGRVKVFMPRSISHYSSTAALGWLGLGTESVEAINVDDRLRLDQRELVRRIEACVSAGQVPLAIVAYCGDSRSMAIDDLPGLSAIALRYGVWLHVDACHGLSLCFSTKLRSRVRGLELADSVTIDPHKVLFTPYAASYVLVREPEKMALIAGVSDIITKEPFSFGQITPFLGSRPFSSLKLWMLMKHLGVDAIGRLVEHRHGLALLAAQRIAESPRFVVMNDVTINNVTFMFVPEGTRRAWERGDLDDAAFAERINHVNGELHRRCFEAGEFYVHTFKLPDLKGVLGVARHIPLQFLRVSIGNPLTTPAVLADLVSYLERLAAQVAEECPQTAHRDDACASVDGDWIAVPTEHRGTGV